MVLDHTGFKCYDFQISYLSEGESSVSSLDIPRLFSPTNLLVPIKLIVTFFVYLCMDCHTHINPYDKLESPDQRYLVF
jgi:quinol-cytochrome oxidoreductase complex cytochrome b subunit